MHYGTSMGRAPNSYEFAVKQAEVEFRNNVLIQGEEPRRVVMDVVSGTIEAHGDRIVDILTTVSSFIDRLFGPQPEPGVNTIPEPASPGRLPAIERSLERNERLLNELAAKARLLGGIA